MEAEMRESWNGSGRGEKVINRTAWARNPRKNKEQRHYQAFFSSELKVELRNTYEKWKAAGRPGGTFNILDLGGGEGKALKKMLRSLKRPKDVRIIHHNLLPDEFGRRKIGTKIAAEAGALPFKDNSIHFATSVWAIPYKKDKLAVMKEVDRVLHPDGWAALHLSLNKEEIETKEGRVQLSEWLNKHRIRLENPLGIVVSFKKGIKLPETRLKSYSPITQGLIFDVSAPHPIESVYEVVE